MLPNGVEEMHDRDGLGDIGLAAALTDALLVALHGEGGHGDDGDVVQLLVVLQPFGDFQARDFRQLNIIRIRSG